MDAKRNMAGIQNVRNIIQSGEEELRANFTLKFAQAINRSEKNRKIQEGMKRINNNNDAI